VVGVEAFAALRRLRLAARAIARDESLGFGRYWALVRLVELGRAEFADNPFLVAQVRPIVWSEGGELFEGGRTPEAPSQSWRADPVTMALWMLRRRGLVSCPTCKRRIPEAVTLARHEDLDRANWAETVAREQAPKREAAAAEDRP
jgi:hypothetical protein